MIGVTFFTFLIESKNHKEELSQFNRNDVWDLVPKSKRVNIIGTKWIYPVPKSKVVNIIGTKWIYNSKTDEEGNIIRNKAKLVA